VEQRTFSGQYAAAAGQPVLYVTERCVFRLTPDGLELIEIAPGIDLDKDVLAHVGFTPIINADPTLMDPRLFLDEPMGLKDDLLTVPLDARFTYDAERNIFFINMEALSVNTPAQAEAIVGEIEKRLTAVGKKVPVVVNYDNFYLAPGLADTYTAAVRSLTERFYQTVTRYTTSSFMRLKLAGHLTERGLAPHIYESHQEAVGWLTKTEPPTSAETSGSNT
jgi:propionate CoA-transferase